MTDMQELTMLFMRGDIRSALAYMKDVPELTSMYQPLEDIFVKENFLHFDLPQICDEILLQYQVYFCEVFYKRVDKEVAEKKLLTSLYSFVKDRITVNPDNSDEGVCAEGEGIFRMVSDIEAALVDLFKENGLYFKGGVTNGFYGPYVWKKSEIRTFKVQLPEGISFYSVVMMKDFVMRSWMAYLTFGMYGTKGWASDGLIHCVESAYDFESPSFQISLLKHEAQHVEDKKRWPNMEPWQLEYRAKLVELCYWEGTELLSKFLSEADESRVDDSHAVASVRLKKEFSDLLPIQEESDELFCKRIQEKALALFKSDTSIC